MKPNRKERGQVLVIVILAIVGMFGFAAIAVDGGRFFAERRRAQNAADAAAYAAAYAGLNGRDYRAAGIASTRTNGYDDTDGTINASTTLDNVQINHPPTRGRYATVSETVNPNQYYQVIIRKRVDKILSQFVFQGGLWVEVEAITRGTGHGSFASGGALVQTCVEEPDGRCCDPLKLGGSGISFIQDGDIISNSICAEYSMRLNDTVCTEIENGNIITVGGLYTHEPGKCPGDERLDLDPGHEAITNTGNPENYMIPHQPSCSGLGTINTYRYNSSATLGPGIYSHGITIAGKKTAITLSPGLYCLDGDLTLSSGSLNGEGVMIYLRSGSVTLNNTNTSVRLTAPSDPCIDDPGLEDMCWSGILFSMPYENDGNIALAGGGTNQYVGMIYAPGPSSNGNYKCSIAGGTDSPEGKADLIGSIICYTVDVTGGGGLKIQYDDSMLPPTNGVIEITE